MSRSAVAEWYRSASLPFRVYDGGELEAAGVTLTSVLDSRFEQLTRTNPETWADITDQVTFSAVVIESTGQYAGRAGICVMDRDAGEDVVTPAPNGRYRTVHRCARSDGAQWIGVQNIRVMPEPNPVP